jgi:hypothetical protein
LAISCSKKDESFCGDPPPNWLLISINDTANNSLIGSVYTQKYFRFYDNQGELYLKPFWGDSSLLQLFYAEIESGKEYYLELDGTDTDTMSFDFNTEILKCYTSYALDYITYNGDRTPREYTFEHNILVKR